MFEEKEYGGVCLAEALQFHHEGAVGGKDVASFDVGGWTARLVKNLKQHATCTVTHFHVQYMTYMIVYTIV